jgi:DNA-binding transcriptional LysR family regulator
MQIDFLGMQAFLAIVEHGGFQQAADHLHLSQTAVSHRIRKLEDALGVTLLARTTRDVTLTDAGRALLPRVRSAIREFERSYDTVRQYHRSAPTWLAFACLPTLAAHHLSPALGRFAAAHPGVSVRVFDTSIGEIAELVESQTAAFGISVPASNRFGLAIDVFAEEPFVLACPAGHRLAQRERVGWQDLAGEALIRISLPAGNSTTIDDALGERRTQLRWIYEAQHTAVALDMVASGLGLTMVPALAVGNTPGVIALPLVEPRITRRLAVVMRRAAQLASPAVELRDSVLDGLRDALSSVSGPAS